MSIFEHFRPEEKPFVEKIMEWAEMVSQRKDERLTHFLDPREQFILQAIVGRHSDIEVYFFGGYEGAERKRALICPDYLDPNTDEYAITLLSIEGNYKSLPFEHRDVLGSLVGLGLKRDRLGDILLTEEKQQIVVANEIADYIQIHLQQISRYSIRCEAVSLSEVAIPSEDWRFQNKTVSSLRLDVILSELLSSSRAKITPLIKAGRVKVNWKVVEQTSLTLKEGDILSVKGHGRFLFAEIEGLTKKEKFRVKLGKKD